MSNHTKTELIEKTFKMAERFIVAVEKIATAAETMADAVDRLNGIESHLETLARAVSEVDSHDGRATTTAIAIVSL